MGGDNGRGDIGVSYLFGPNTGVIVGCISSSSDHFPVEYPTSCSLGHLPCPFRSHLGNSVDPSHLHIILIV